MNDELFLKQLNENIPPKDTTRQAETLAGNGDIYPALRSRTWSSERTQHIVWELPAEPRFHVSRGGVQRDWQLARQVGANLTFLTLLILALVLWPHSRPRPVSSTPSALAPPTSALFPQSERLSAPAAYRPDPSGRQLASRNSTGVWTSAMSVNPTLRVRPSLYADNPFQSYAIPRFPLSYRPAVPYRVTCYRTAPAAPLAGSVPPLQSPY